MSRVAASVHIVATDGPSGKAGYTATAFMPVSDAPATVLVAINRGGRSGAVIGANRVFAVSVLGARHRALADIFAGRAPQTGDDRFDLAQWRRLATGAPGLADAVAVFDCRVVDTVPVATHDIVIGQVVDLVVGGSGGLLYHERDYKPL